MPQRRRAIPLLALVALAACARPPRDRPLDVSLIGTAPTLVDPNVAAPDPPAAALLDATAQGLVAFDQSGQIEPALAERWTVYDEGRSFIFRIADARWPDGKPITAAEVARRLRSIANPAGRNALAPLLGAVDEISAVTPQVVEIDLRSPRPYLLQLLAQPDAALLHGNAGSGPMRIAEKQGGALLLRPLPDPDADAGSGAGPAEAARDVRLRGERGAMAVARFMLGRVDAVLGGSFADLPIVRAARPAPALLRFDPAQGLFGLAFVAASEGLLADPANRRALAMAIDRDALAVTLGVPGWRPFTGLVAPGRPDLPASARPDWDATAIDARRSTAAGQIASWTAANAAAPALRVALPDGPGARLLLARLAADWRAIGVAVEAVRTDAPADLRLVDLVAPSDSASFYLRRFACARAVPCTPESEVALDTARAAPTLADRAAALGQADKLIIANTPFIALGPPIRWSLVSPVAAGWRPSPRALHPLATLRARPG